MRLSSILLTLLFGAACADSSLNAERDADDFDTDSLHDPDDDTDSSPQSAIYWSLDGELTLIGGAIDPVQSQVSVHFEGDDEEPCEFDPPILTGLPTLPPDDESLGLIGWWSIELDTSTSPCEPQVPSHAGVGNTVIELGFGAYDTRLDPAARAAGLRPDTFDVYGLYITDPAVPDAIYVFGVAGTPGNFVGTTPSADDELPDGTYLVVPLHLLPRIAAD